MGPRWADCSPYLTGALFPTLGPSLLMLVAAGLLALTLPFVGWARRAVPPGSRGLGPQAGDREHGGALGGFSLVLTDRYLFLLALMILLLNWVNTTGEYVLSNAARQYAMEVVPATAHADLAGEVRDAAISADRREVIKAFYSDFFSWVNLVGFLIQAFIVSRVLDKICKPSSL